MPNNDQYSTNQHALSPNFPYASMKAFVLDTSYMQKKYH